MTVILCAAGSSASGNSNIPAAIQSIQTELLSRHVTPHCWDAARPPSGWRRRNWGGTTALVVDALLSAGTPPSTPQVAEGIAFIRDVENPGTYVLALRTSVWSLLPPRFEEDLQRDTARLVQTMGAVCGGWGYEDTPPPQLADASPSVRQFGMLALRAAARRGLSVPQGCWVSIARATLTTQQPDGGWSYYRDPGRRLRTTGSMTSAGLNCLLAVDEILGPRLNRKDRTNLERGIAGGVAWLDANFTSDRNPFGTNPAYYLYSLEQAAMTCGTFSLRGHDWYRAGAASLISRHCTGSSVRGSTIDLAFALLFLSRGLAPLAVQELVQPASPIDHWRTCDRLTTRLSTMIERPLSWRRIHLEDELDAQLASPVLLLQDASLLQTAGERMQRFFARGGTLLVLSDRRGAMTTIDRCIEKMLPHAERHRTDADHWSRSLQRQAPGVNVTAWNDGLRDRILLVPGNPRTLLKEDSPLEHALHNIMLGCAELHRWRAGGRDEAPVPNLPPISVARHNGRWDADLAGLRRLGAKVIDMQSAAGPTLVILGGIAASEATEDLASDVLAAAERGAAVLVETIGGQAGFARSLRRLIEDRLGRKATTLDHSPDVSFRGWTILTGADRPKMASLPVESGRIVFTDLDVRNAFLNHPCWGVHGYDAAAAEAILRRLAAPG
ncbi:MAG: hypothetical protein QGH76_08780 [Phycisphaerales bacterium]|nr:hypothetical protein [Phycisphaerales bacterium]